MATEGEGTQSGAEGSQSGAGDNTGGTDNSGTETNSGTTGTQSGSETGNTDAEAARKEAETYRERMKAADKRAADLEAKYKQLVDKDLPEQAKLQRDLQEATKRSEELQSRNQELALANAFLKDNTFAWHNPERALKLADLSGVEVNDDGSVTGLKEALTALSKSDAYLLKTEKADEEKDKTPPGTAPGNNGSSGTGKPGTKALAARFPGLNTRVRR